MMVDSSAFIHDSLSPGLKHLKLEETSGKIQSFTECFVSGIVTKHSVKVFYTVPLSWGQNCCCFHGCCGWCSLHSLLSAGSVLACPKEGFRDGEGSRGEATRGVA